MPNEEYDATADRREYEERPYTVSCKCGACASASEKDLKELGWGLSKAGEFCPSCRGDDMSNLRREMCTACGHGKGLHVQPPGMGTQCSECHCASFTLRRQKPVCTKCGGVWDNTNPLDMYDCENHCPPAESDLCDV